MDADSRFFVKEVAHQSHERADNNGIRYRPVRTERVELYNGLLLRRAPRRDVGVPDKGRLSLRRSACGVSAMLQESRNGFCDRIKSEACDCLRITSLRPCAPARLIGKRSQRSESVILSNCARLA